MTEGEFQAEVIRIMDDLGLAWHHDRDSRRVQGTPGFLDLFIAGPRGVMVRELKTDDGDTSADQDGWLYVLDLAGRWMHPPVGRLSDVWRTADLKSGRIRAELEALI